MQKNVEMDIIQLVSEIKEPFNSLLELKDIIAVKYSYFGCKPDVTISGDIITIHFDDKKISETTNVFDKANALCAQGKFIEAEPLLKKVIDIFPFYADAYRTLAQSYMMRGMFDDALDVNLETLKIDKTNLWGLILMGNILAKKDDIEGANIYYNKVLEYYPDNALALNNLGAVRLEQKCFDEAIEIFEKAMKIDDTYPNTYYGLAMAYYQMKNYSSAFDTCSIGIKTSKDRKENPSVRSEILNLMVASANEITKGYSFGKEIIAVKKELEQKGSRNISIIEDDTMSICAQLKYAVTHNTKDHRVIVNSNKPYADHLIMHEMAHLAMSIDAAKEGRNMIVYSNAENVKNFDLKFDSLLRPLKKKVGIDGYSKFKQSLMSGLTLQLMNCPLDLLVEDWIYNNKRDMRPLQFISLFTMEKDNIESVRQGSKSQDIPYKIVSLNRTMNLVTSMHFKALYGVDLINQYQAPKAELNLAKDLYTEYEAYKEDFKPGDEYEMMMYFIEQLDCDDLVQIMNEREFSPLQVNREELSKMTDEERGERRDSFVEDHPDGADATETMMMAMYMVGAMQFFEKQNSSMVQRIALEIAMLGCSGISINKKSGYSIQSMPEKDFGGYELLAYYYVSWAMAYPEKLETLKLPYKSAYEMAKKMRQK